MTTPSVPNSTKPAKTENPIEEIEEIVEHVFTPRPGGMVDSWHKERARREAAQREAENAAEKIEESASYTVKVAQIMPEITGTNLVTLAAGATAMILPNAPYRYRATLIVATAAVTTGLVLSRDQSQALGGVGFPLPTGIPLIINSRGQLWATNTTGATIQIGVLLESYAPEK